VYDILQVTVSHSQASSKVIWTNILLRIFCWSSMCYARNKELSGSHVNRNSTCLIGRAEYRELCGGNVLINSGYLYSMHQKLTYYHFKNFPKIPLTMPMSICILARDINLTILFIDKCMYICCICDNTYIW